MIGCQQVLAILLFSGSLLIQAQDAGRGVYNPRCGPVCQIYCPYGNVLDSRGCPLCQCNEYPTYCGPVCTNLGCPNGFETDTRGCPICQCKPVLDTCRDKCQGYCQTGRNQPYDCVCDCGVYRPFRV